MWRVVFCDVFVEIGKSAVAIKIRWMKILSWPSVDLGYSFTTSQKKFCSSYTVPSDSTEMTNDENVL